MKTTLRSVAVALTMIGLAVAARPLAQEGDSLKVVTTGEMAYLLGPVESVTRGRIEGIFPAPSGRYALIQLRVPERAAQPGDEKPIPTRPTLLQWDARSQRTTTIWRGAVESPGEPGATVMVHGFFADSAVALVDFIRPGSDRGEIFHTLQRLNCVTATLAPVAAEEPGLSRISFSPSRPAAMLYGGPGPGRLLTSDGQVRATTLPIDATPMLWLPDGDRIHVRQLTIGPDGKPTGRRLSTFSLRTGQLTPLEKLPAADLEAARKEPPPPPIALRQARAALKGPSSENRVEALYLERREPPKSEKDAPPYGRALVTAETDPGSDPLLLPDLSAALWRYEGALYARPIFSLDRTAFQTLLDAQQRRVAINDAKQVGLALMMYAQDYDENFPGQGAGIGVVDPYLKNADMLARFTFTYMGPTNLSAIDKPAETQLGYVNGPGGRAIVFADGHVRWIAN